jgi:hypothetical protein
MGDQLGKMMLLGESDKGIHICMVDVLSLAATGIACEKANVSALMLTASFPIAR